MKKKLLVVLTLLVVLLSIGSVAAEDIATDLTTGTTIEDVNTETLGAINTNSFDYIQQQINNAGYNQTIILTGEYIGGENQTININNKTINFEGNGLTILNGNDDSIFNITNYSTVSFKNIKFTNANGGAILSNSAIISIDTCDFNQCTGIFGSVLNLENVRLNLINSNITQ